MNPSSEPRPEDLIGDQDWIRPLVQQLVRDEARAQDVLQSTWLRALRQPPRAEAGSPSRRNWLARVARNLALRDGALESARRQRELRAARGERLPSTLEIAEREELRAKIVAHVLALPEPYRATLVLRFYEGLEPRAIARAQGVNGSTVRNRIARGLALLRERMQREQGQEWVSSCLAVLPLGSAKLLVAHASWTGWIAKGGVVAKKFEIAAAAALAVTAGAVWIAWPTRGAGEGLERGGGAAVALSKETGGVELPRGRSAGDAGLENAEAGAGARTAGRVRQPALEAEAGAQANVRVFGHVRDTRGQSIQGSNGTISFQLQAGPQNGELPQVIDISGDEPIKSEGTLELRLGSVLEGEKQADREAQEKSVDAKNVLLLDIDTLRADKLQGDLQAEDLLRAGVESQLRTSLMRFMTLAATKIVFVDDQGCQHEASAASDGDYSVDGLHAGRWQVVVTHNDYVARRAQLELGENEHLRQLDFVLDDPLRVRVKLRTPDGRDLEQAIAQDRELSFRADLSPIALRPGSAARFLPEGRHQAFGCGRYEAREDLKDEQRTAIGEASGVLVLSEEPPLDVGLVISGMLVARQTLAPGQEEVSFVVSLDELRRAFATVLVRVVDATTHKPIPNASVTLGGVRCLTEAPPLAPDADPAEQAAQEEQAKARADHAGPRTDAQGVVQIPWVPTGKRALDVRAAGFTPFTANIEIESSGPCELRPVELTGSSTLTGHFLRPDGTALKASYQLVPLDRFEETHESAANPTWSSNDDGTFETVARRERYVLRVTDGDDVLAPVVVDLSQGDVRDLVLHLVAPVEAELRFSREPKEGAELRILNAQGVPVAERDLAGLEPAVFSLAPGSYSAELREGKHKAGSARFVVGKERVSTLLTLD